MRQTVGRRLDDLESTFKRLKRMPDLFEPGRGTGFRSGAGTKGATEETAETAAWPGPRRRPASRRVDRTPMRAAAPPTAAPTAPPHLLPQALDTAAVADRLDAVTFLWQMVIDLDASERGLRARAAEQVAAAGDCGGPYGAHALEALLAVVAPIMRARGLHDGYLDRLLAAAPPAPRAAAPRRASERWGATA